MEGSLERSEAHKLGKRRGTGQDAKHKRGKSSMSCIGALEGKNKENAREDVSEVTAENSQDC